MHQAGLGNTSRDTHQVDLGSTRITYKPGFGSTKCYMHQVDLDTTRYDMHQANLGSTRIAYNPVLVAQNVICIELTLVARVNTHHADLGSTRCDHKS